MRDTNIVAQFSNYSAENVDVFAPGELIYSTIPDDQYELLNGTSMAAPVVSGMAAVIRSYFPTLTAEQVKRVLEESVIKLDQEVIKPGGDELIPFAELSKTGGVVNLYQAYELAARTKGKKKVKEEKRRDRV
jgi:subtilisin family serine protease